jgi:hypothetical protein
MMSPELASSEVIDEVWRRSGGNPLFLRALTVGGSS